MKTRSIFIISLFGFFPLLLKAQYPNINGISTNPANPVNTQLPAKKNNFFNWQLERWQVKPLPSQGNCAREDSVTSPFFRLNNAEELRVSKDMKWDDGWELIYRGVGLTDQNQPLPDSDPDITIVLYNKYTGMMRVLMQTCRGADYNAAQIVIQFDGSGSMKTDLLEFSRGNVSALDKKFTEVMGSAGYPYTNNNSKWFYADFPMMFDPCTPIYQSKLKIVTKLITTSQITLSGKIAGEAYTKDISGKANVEKLGSFSWVNSNTFLAASKFAQTFQSDTAKMVNEFLQYIINQQNNNAGNATAMQQLGASINTIPFLKDGLSKYPWLKRALAVVDAFVSGGKKAEAAGQQTVKLMPMAINLTANLQGTLNSDYEYNKTIFTNPGSKDAQLDPAGYPYYNEVLGVFNLIKTPEFWYERRVENLNDYYNYPWISCTTPNTPVYGQCQALRVYADRFKLDTSTFKYVLNPAAGLTIQNMQLELIVKGEHTPSYYITGPDPYLKRDMNYDFIFNGKDGVNGSFKFGTKELLHAKTFAKRTFKVLSNTSPYYPNNYYGMWNVWRPVGTPVGSTDTTAYLKIVLNLKRNNTNASTQNVLYVLTYPVKLKYGGNMQYWENDMAYINTQQQDTTLLMPASAAEVDAFCRSNIYWNLDRQNRNPQDTVTLQQQLEKDGLQLYPNPTGGEFTLKFKKSGFLLTKIQVVNMAGTVVYTEDLGNQPLHNGYIRKLNLALPSGTYIINAITTGDVKRVKMIVAR